MNRSLKTFTALVAVASLAACDFIPDYLQPELPTALSWSGAEQAQAPLSEQGQAAASAISWQTFFASPELKTVIQTALENNRDLRVAALNVEAAQALYRIERADILPTVDANATHPRQKVTKAQSTANPLFRAPQEFINSSYAVNLSTAFELDLFGRLRSESESALETFFATKAARDAAQISLIAEVSNAYLQWLADRKILELTQDTLVTQEESLKIIQKSFDSGLGSKLDVAQVRQAVHAAQANQALYARRVEQDKNALILLMGVKELPAGIEHLKLENVALMKELPVGLPAEVLVLRPDVQQAEHALKAANANIGAARAAFLPRISLTGSYGYASADLDKLFSSSAWGAWSFAPQITMPIFQGGRNMANLDYASLKKEASVAQYEQAVMGAFREVADELAARNTLDAQFGAQKSLADAAEESYDLSMARYKQGVDSFLNVLDAQRSYFSAQQQQIEIEKQRLANMVNLYKALGGGLVSETATAQN